MRRSETLRSVLFILAGGVLPLILLLPALCRAAEPADDDLGAIRIQFQQQTDPVKRAKMFPKLGSALLAEMKKQVVAKEYDKVIPLFLEYRDSANAAYTALVAAVPDGEKHPGGYREMEIHLRRSLHTLNDIVFAVPLEDRDQLLTPQRDIETLDNRLVRALFPRGPQAHWTQTSLADWRPEA